MALTSSKEILSSPIEIKETIAEYAEKKGLSLSAEDLAQHGKEILTKKQRDLLEQWKASLHEVIRFDLDYLSSNVDTTGIESAINKSGEALKKWNIEAKNAFDSAENQMNELLWDAKESDIAKKTKTWLQQAKKAAEWAGIWNIFNKIWTFLEWSIFGDLFKWITGLFWKFQNLIWFWEKAEQVTEKIKDALDPEKREETILWVKTQLSEQFPEKSEHINTLLKSENLDEQALVLISEKIKKWEKINITDFYSLSPSLEGLLFSEEELKEKVEEVKQKMFLSMKVDIEKNLLNWEQLSPEQTQELSKTIWELWINESTIQSIEADFRENDRISMANILPLISTLWMESGVFLTKLIYRGIIPTSYIAAETASVWYDVVKLSIAPLGIFEELNIDSLNDITPDMTPEQKSILTMLIYKKGGMIFKTAGMLTEALARVWVEAATTTTVTWLQVYKASFNSNYQKQIENLKTIWDMLWDKNINSSIKTLTDAQQNLNHVMKNYKYIHVLQDPLLKTTWDKITALKKFWLNTDYLSADMSQAELNQKVKSNHIKTKFQLNLVDNGWKTSVLKNNLLWTWSTSDLRDFNKVLTATWKAQEMLVTWTIRWKILWKWLEMMHLPDISRLWDRLVFNFKSAKEAKVFAELIKRSPEMIGGIMWKLPIISIVWLSTIQDGDFMENLWNSFIDLIPFVGPINMISQWTLTWIKSWEMSLENMTTMWAGFLLLWVDSVFAFKEVAKWIANGTWWFSWLARYMAQPIRDIYGIWRWLWEFWYVALKWAPGSLKQLTKEAISKCKHLKWKVRAIAILWILWVWISKTAFAGDNEIEEYFTDNTLDKEKLKLATLTQKEKEVAFEYIYNNSQEDKFTKNIKFEIKDNILHVYSKNENIKSDWSIDNNILDLLQINPNINFQFLA